MNPDYPQGQPADSYYKLNSASASASAGGFKEPLEYDEAANPRQQTPNGFVPVPPFGQFDGQYSPTGRPMQSHQNLPNHPNLPSHQNPQPHLQHPNFQVPLHLSQQAPPQPHPHGMGQPFQNGLGQNHHQPNHQQIQLQPQSIQQYQQLPQHLPHQAHLQHPGLPQSQPSQPTMAHNQPASNPQPHNPQHPVPPKDDKEATQFQEQDVELLKQLLPAGEKHKWKQIAKQLNRRNNNNGDGNCNENGNSSETTSTRISSSLESEEDSSNGQSATPARKNVSATYVVRQYQHMLGLPKASGTFGDLASSLPYAVAEKGWDDVDEEEASLLDES